MRARAKSNDKEKRGVQRRLKRRNARGLSPILKNGDILFWIISQRILPPVVAVIPICVMFQQLKLLDTHAGLILTYMAVNLPIVVWLMYDFFSTVPKELEESAELDGASKYRVFFAIVPPLATPGLAATSLLVLNWAWNEYLPALFLSTANGPDHAVTGRRPKRNPRAAVVGHVGVDRNHDRPGRRPDCSATEIYRQRAAAGSD